MLDMELIISLMQCILWVGKMGGGGGGGVGARWGGVGGLGIGIGVEVVVGNSAAGKLHPKRRIGLLRRGSRDGAQLFPRTAARARPRAGGQKRRSGAEGGAGAWHGLASAPVNKTSPQATPFSHEAGRGGRRGAQCGFKTREQLDKGAGHHHQGVL